MIKYIETNSAKCGIPPQIADPLRRSHNKHREDAAAGLRGRATGADKRPEFGAG
jgi:hypothetical protein